MSCEDFRAILNVSVLADKPGTFQMSHPEYQMQPKFCKNWTLSDLIRLTRQKANPPVFHSNFVSDGKLANNHLTVVRDMQIQGHYESRSNARVQMRIITLCLTCDSSSDRHPEKPLGGQIEGDLIQGI
ncbi:hypothetical protein CLF_105611, partial [Clonorchis sinensis]